MGLLSKSDIQKFDVAVIKCKVLFIKVDMTYIWRGEF